MDSLTLVSYSLLQTLFG